MAEADRVEAWVKVWAGNWHFGLLYFCGQTPRREILWAPVAKPMCFCSI